MTKGDNDAVKLLLRRWNLPTGLWVIVWSPDEVFRETVIFSQELAYSLMGGVLPLGSEFTHIVSGKRFVVAPQQFEESSTEPKEVEKFTTAHSEQRRQVYRKARWPANKKLPADLRDVD